jgi:hypothetical protein
MDLSELVDKEKRVEEKKGRDAKSRSYDMGYMYLK